MSHIIKVRNKRHAAQIRKFVEREGMQDDTHPHAVWKVGNYVHLWFDLPHKAFMVWSPNSYERGCDVPTSLRELYATRKQAV